VKTYGSKSSKSGGYKTYGSKAAKSKGTNYVSFLLTVKLKHVTNIDGYLQGHSSFTGAP
jgi:hypothetical protein